VVVRDNASQLIPGAALVLSLAGCPGSVRLEPTPSAAPGLAAVTTLTERTVLRGQIPDPTDLSGYAGYVLEVSGPRELAPWPGDVAIPMSRCAVRDDPPPTLSYRRYVNADVVLGTRPVTNLWYQAKVQRGMAATSSLLTFASALSDTQRAEVLIEDIARQDVPDAAVPHAALDSLSSEPLPAGVCARFFIRAAVLMSVKYRTYTRVSRAGAIRGTAFAEGDGHIYASDESFVSHLFLALDLRPLRRDPQPTAVLLPGPYPPPSIAVPLRSARRQM
jgi:hypothetical protein